MPKRPEPLKAYHFEIECGPNAILFRDWITSVKVSTNVESKISRVSIRMMNVKDERIASSLYNILCESLKNGRAVIIHDLNLKGEKVESTRYEIEDCDVSIVRDYASQGFQEITIEILSKQPDAPPELYMSLFEL